MAALRGDRNRAQRSGVSYRGATNNIPDTFAQDVQAASDVPGSTDNDVQSWIDHLAESSSFKVHDVADELTSPDGADRLAASDESATDDPNKWITLNRLGAWIKQNLPFNLRNDVTTEVTSLATNDRMLISDTSQAQRANRWISFQTLSNWLASRLSFDVHDDSGTELSALGAADRLPISDESTSGHPMHYTTLGGLTDYFRETVAAFEGPWSGIANNRDIRTGTIVTHSGFVYLCRVEHQKGGTGPDADTANWLLLNNWGGDWVDRYYHVGTLVEHVESTWVSNQAVNQGDPAPGASNNVKWTLVSGASRNLGQSLQRLQELLVDVHLGNQGHPTNYAETTVANAVIGPFGTTNWDRASATDAVTSDQGTAATNTISDPVYPLIFLPHEADARLYRLTVTLRNGGAFPPLIVSQMWNIGNRTYNGVQIKMFSTYRQASIPAGARVVLERAGSINHVGTTEFAGFLTGQLKVTTYPDVTGAAILITEAQLDALEIKVAGKLYVRTD